MFEEQAKQKVADIIFEIYEALSTKGFAVDETGDVDLVMRTKTTFIRVYEFCSAGDGRIELGLSIHQRIQGVGVLCQLLFKVVIDSEGSTLHLIKEVGEKELIIELGEYSIELLLEKSTPYL